MDRSRVRACLSELVSVPSNVDSDKENEITADELELRYYIDVGWLGTYGLGRYILSIAGKYLFKYNKLR